MNPAALFAAGQAILSFLAAHPDQVHLVIEDATAILEQLNVLHATLAAGKPLA